MSDYKTNYSEQSEKYIREDVQKNEEDYKHYISSKRNEEKYNNDWKELKVNINDVVDQFKANKKSYKTGYKYNFEGEEYTVVADMVAGYLRIYNNETKQPLKLNGKPGSRMETHFKIKRKEEM